MPTARAASRMRRGTLRAVSALLTIAAGASAVMAQAHGGAGGAQHHGGEANLILPDLSSQQFLGLDGHTLLLVGILVCILGLAFGFVTFLQLKRLPVHRSMREIS